MPVRMNVTIHFSYDVPDERMERSYGTTDPQRMADIDEENYVADPASLLDAIDLAAEDTDNLTIQVEGVRLDEEA